MEPKGTKMDPKGTKMEPKEPKREPKGAKREPKGDQNASKNQCPKKVAKKVLQGGAAACHDMPFWEPFSIKNVIKNL